MCDPRNVLKRKCEAEVTDMPNGSQSSNGIAGNTSKGKWLCCIRIRIRRLDHPQKLLDLPTQLAIFFHELAHLRWVSIPGTGSWTFHTALSHKGLRMASILDLLDCRFMNHGIEFARLLASIFRYATRNGLFRLVSSLIPALRMAYTVQQ